MHDITEYYFELYLKERFCNKKNVKNKQSVKKTIKHGKNK